MPRAVKAATKAATVAEFHEALQDVNKATAVLIEAKARAKATLSHFKRVTKAKKTPAEVQQAAVSNSKAVKTEQDAVAAKTQAENKLRALRTKVKNQKSGANEALKKARAAVAAKGSAAAKAKAAADLMLATTALQKANEIVEALKPAAAEPKIVEEVKRFVSRQKPPLYQCAPNCTHFRDSPRGRGREGRIQTTCRRNVVL